ncbi:hypothetical protein H8N03_12385 [Ramlibacter sp. USB13]|uniref:MFS transporter permease n=1 Tax=Ramlibacter cellulosilyticus TaxID=2764187 RepID=A0A923SBD4_9BURK|nr:DUF6064 family protein [Ramlibacter cellulosilyticus]MBC5783745.1 hypothetical protein [Ramlibacter cellulosilyticus]
MLPFTHQQFLDVLSAYNAAAWPAQVLAYLAGLAACFALVRRGPGSGRFVATTLAVGWAWTGVAYHLLQFTHINPAAYAFGALFLLQSALFLLAGWQGRLEFGAAGGPRRVLAWALFAYSGVVYPLIGLAAGMPAAQLPMFGITPCPLTLFTFGVLLLATARLPWWLVVVPSAWALVGGSAAFLLQVPQDWPLFFSVLLVPVLVRHRRGDAVTATATP